MVYKYTGSPIFKRRNFTQLNRTPNETTFTPTTFTFPTVIYNRGKVLESAQENSKISSCFVLWEP